MTTNRRRSRPSDRKGAGNARREGARARTGGPAQASGTPEAAGSGEAAASAARPARWWDRFPGRREYELEALREGGFEPVVVEDADRYVVRVTIPFDGARHEAFVKFPDLYPYVRCEVVAPRLTLRKHQNPFGGNLCLLDRSTAAWQVDDTAAQLLLEQLPGIEEAVRDAGPRPDLEVAQAEPISTYYEPSTEAGSIVFMPPEAATLPAGIKGGKLQIVTVREGARLRGVVTAVNDLRVTMSKGLRSQPGGESIAVEWVRLAAPPPPPATMVQELIAKGVISVPWLADGGEMLFGLAFSEEVTYEGPAELAWLFVRWQRHGEHTTAPLIRAERFDPAEQAIRVPALVGLAGKKVTVFGLGGVGAPLVHQLAQMRTGQLRLIDQDLVRAGNAVRWPLGLGAAGLRKVDALTSFLRAQYPETEIVPINWRIGASALDDDSPDELRLLAAALDGADLVIEATTELGLQHLITDAARERGVPVITIEGRAGGYGGIVARYRPAGPGCYLCFKLHQEDGQFVVPDDPVGRDIQPRGCADRTFTGASFDIAPISLLGARMAAQTLVASEAFPDAPYDVALLFNRDAPGAPAPRWEYHELVAHPDCPRCRSAAS